MILISFNYMSRSLTVHIHPCMHCFLHPVYAIRSCIGTSSRILIHNTFFSESCSHGRAYVYFAESITHPHNFPAYPCKDWLEYKLGKCTKDPVFMGDAVNQQTRGNFFLHTNSERLFGVPATSKSTRQLTIN